MHPCLRMSILLTLTVVAGTVICLGQELVQRFTNTDIVEMSTAGLSDDLILAKIQSVHGNGLTSFDTSVAGLKALKAAGVSDPVIKGMINPAGLHSSFATSPQVSGSKVLPVTGYPNLPPPETGVYWRDQDKFVFIEGQVVSQSKVGGKVGSFVTSGVRSQHWDAYLANATSKHRVKDLRPVFYFYVPEGSSSADYVLIRLEKKRDHREFQTGSFGGLMGGRSGVRKGREIQFKSEHVGTRTYRITLEENLHAGEYAFFMRTGQQAMMTNRKVAASSGGNATGRIYDFSVAD